MTWEPLPFAKYTKASDCLARMNFCVHESHSQSVADGFRLSSAHVNLNQIVPVRFFHEWKAGEKQTGWAQPLSRQYATFSGTPKTPHSVKQRQNFIQRRRFDFFKEAVSGTARLAAAATAFSLMALHVFPSKSHPKSMFAVFSAIASRSSQVSPKSGASKTFVFKATRS